MSDDGTRSEPPTPERSRAEATADTLSAPATRAQGLGLPLIDRSAYQVGEELARGGLGRILHATDKRLDRPVAIKELLHEGEDYEARFAREALLTARLQHPAIVPVYEAGVWTDGSPFYAMKLVSGRSLEAAVRERPTLPERLELLPHVIRVVEALAYAHERRIIHRDLKPANVLVGAFGETVVIDWGLAKQLDEPEDLRLTRPRVAAGTGGSAGGETQAGLVLGTPAYMAPEQALGMRVDARADVYALGSLLYHVLGGAPPYSGVSSQHILTVVARGRPEPLLEKEPAVPPELCAIVAKAMARDPDDRYATAADLAADLHRYVRGQLVSAQRYSRAMLVARWLRRHRAPVLVGAAMLVLLVAVTTLSFRRVVAERDVARAERAEAQRLRLEADLRGDELALREAEALLGRDPRAALGWLMKLSPESRAVGAARVVAADAAARGLPARVVEAAAYAVAISPDAALLAIGRGGDVLIDDVASGQRLVLPGRGGADGALAFSPSGARLAFAGLAGSLRLWERSVRAAADLPGHAADVVALGFAGDARLVSVARDGSLRIAALGTGEPPRQIAAHDGEARDLSCAPDMIATAGADGLVRLWSIAGDPVASLRHGGPLARVALAPGARRVASLGDDGSLKVWDVAARRAIFATQLGGESRLVAWVGADRLASADSGGTIWLWEVDGGRARRLAGSEDEVLALISDGRRVFAAGRDHAVWIWDPAGGAARALRGHDGDVIALAAAGPLLASAARDRSVRLWNLEAGLPRLLPAPPGQLLALAASADGQRLAGATATEVWQWEVASGQARPLAPPGGTVRALAVSPDAAGVAAGADDGRVLLYSGGAAAATLGRLDGPVLLLAFDLRSRLLAAGGPRGLELFDVAGSAIRVADRAPITGLAFSPGGSLLATSGEGVRLWDVDRKTFRALGGAAGPFAAVAFSPDGHRLAAAAATGPTVVVWTVGTGELVRLAGPGAAVERLAFADGGRALVAIGADHKLRVWGLESREARALAGLAGAPASLAVSPDGRTVAAGSTGGGVRLWDVGSGRGRTLSGHIGAVGALVWVDGGRTLASAAADGTVRLWPDDLPHDRAALRAWLEKNGPRE